MKSKFFEDLYKKINGKTIYEKVLKIVDWFFDENKFDNGIWVKGEFSKFTKQKN